MANDAVYEELNAGLHEFRGALTELLGSAGVNAQKPLAMSRELGVDKTLAWKVSKVISAPDAGAAFKHLPGTAGLEILLTAVSKHGGKKRTVLRARNAMQKLGKLVERHVDGDRQMLELIVDGHQQSRSDRLVVSRRLSFRGNSGIWGVQAKTRFNTAILAPSSTSEGFVDQATIGGWIDFRRLRSDTRWALFRRTNQIDRGPRREEPLDPAQAPDGPMLIPQFCSDPMPPVQVVHDPSGETVYELMPGTIGSTGAFSCVFGSVIRNVGPRRATKPDDIGWCGAVISAPVEMFQFDLLIHRDLSFVLAAEPRIYGALGLDTSRRAERDRLPLDLPLAPLGRPAEVSTPLIPRYGELIDYAMTRSGWDRSAFTGLRYIIECPPFPSSIVLSFPLERI